MSLADYMAMSGPEPTAHLAYGEAPSQYVEVFKPAGNGPFPVAILVHGGCYLKEFAGITQFRNMAGALSAQGIAVWNIEYRRVDEEGGGYPGTYEDASAALDALSVNASAFHLDVNRVVAVGHSAGGQLVQWMGGRARIPPSSPLYRPNPFPVRHVVNLSGLNDLRAWPDLCGFDESKLTGTASPERPDVFSDTNPADLVPNGSHTVLINGQLDRHVPPDIATRFAVKLRAAGDEVRTVMLPGANHFDEVNTASPSWKVTLAEIKSSLGMTS